jgi:hypothetical protein
MNSNEPMGSIEEVPIDRLSNYQLFKKICDRFSLVCERCSLPISSGTLALLLFVVFLRLFNQAKAQITRASLNHPSRRRKSRL